MTINNNTKNYTDALLANEMLQLIIVAIISFYESDVEYSS